MIDIRKQALLAAGNKAAFKPRSDIEGLGRKLRAIMRKVDAAQLKPNDRQRLADELLRLSGEAQWFADQVSKSCIARDVNVSTQKGFSLV